jgi:hypothetical protein
MAHRLKYEILIVFVPASLLEKKKHNFDISINSGDLSQWVNPCGTLYIREPET